METNRLNAQSFDHFTLVVSDLQASHQFYADLLGLKPAERPAFDFAGAWFELGGVFLHLILANEASGQAGPGDRGTVRPSRGLHFAFRVADAKFAAEQLKSASIEIVDGPKQRPDGATQVFIRDPDGYLVEVFSD
jgi:catechol 2,3-dioxygenase-like lactoylglutathione lyase family enzyme